jgi:signal transduction histidine kinase
MGVLAAGIAHEINNPLTGVVGYSKLLLEKKSLTPDIREKIERIAASGERCRKIVEGVLLFSRQQGGARARVDLRGLIDRVTRIGEYQWKMHNIRIVREHDESVEVMCDPDQIEQVLLNLFSNAVDAMERGGTIRVSLRREPDGSARLSISDEGSGIPEEIQASIFDPFFSTKDIGKGTGLGLAISYGIVRDHGGDISLHSKPRQGATFTIHLPPDGVAQSAAADLAPTTGASAHVGPFDAGPQDSGTFPAGAPRGGSRTGARR